MTDDDTPLTPVAAGPLTPVAAEPLTPVAAEPLTPVAEKPLTVVATLEAEPGQEAALEDVLRALVAPTRAEEGCVAYDLHRSADKPGLFVFHETWSSRPLWEAHMQSPHLRDFGARQDALVARWELFTGEKLQQNPPEPRARSEAPPR